MQRRTVVILLVIIFVLLNAGAYALYRFTRTPEQGGLLDPKELTESGETDEGLVKGYRIAGLAELERGNYDKAVARFTQALRAGGEDEELRELLKIAAELKAGESPSEAIVESGGTPTPTARSTPRSTPRTTRPTRTRVAAKRTPRVPAATPQPLTPAPTVRPSGVIITSQPRGLGVEINGRRVSKTPTRIRMKPGRHRLAFLDGEQRVGQREVFTVIEGQYISIDRDFRAPAPTPTSVVVIPPATPTSTSSGLSTAGLYIVVNASTSISSTSRSATRAVFMGTSDHWANGARVASLLQRPSDSAAGRRFFADVLATSPSRYQQHWQRLQLSGQGVSPAIVRSPKLVIKTVRATPGSAGYVLGGEVEGLDLTGVRLVPVK